jgi:hypothetical protein
LESVRAEMVQPVACVVTRASSVSPAFDGVLTVAVRDVPEPVVNPVATTNGPPGRITVPSPAIEVADEPLTTAGARYTVPVADEVAGAVPTADQVVAVETGPIYAVSETPTSSSQNDALATATEVTPVWNCPILAPVFRALPLV